MKTYERCLENASPLAFAPGKTPTGNILEVKRKAELVIEETSFWELVSPFKQKLYNFINKSLNFSEEADDVFQETILHAFQYFHSYKKGKNFGAWLFAIGHNEINRYYKKASRISSPIIPDRLGSADTSHFQQLVGEVYRFAEKLRPRQREVFFLFYDSGFTISDISHITGLREGNIKFILSQVRNNLKRVLG